MGGCATKPKGFEKADKPHPEIDDRADASGGENKTKEPLVDNSSAPKEAQPSSSDETKAAGATNEPVSLNTAVEAANEPVSSDTAVEAAKPKDDDVKAASKNDDDDHKDDFTDFKVELVNKAEVVDQESNATHTS